MERGAVPLVDAQTTKANRRESRYWCWTVNNPVCLFAEGWQREEDVSDFEWEEEMYIEKRWMPPVTYVAYQLERGAEGTYHLQGYLECRNRVRMSQLKKLRGLGGAHFEFRRGTQEEANQYALKTDDPTYRAGPWVHGKLAEQKQGKAKTTASATLVKRVREGASDLQLWDEFPGLMLIHHRGASVARSVFRKPDRDMMPSVFVFCGTPGTGKSRTAHQIANYLGSVFRVPTAKSSGLYWDGYEQQDVIILDDFNGNRCKPDFFKQLCDRYPFSVPVHQRGNVNFNSRYIFITSNYAPRFWWSKMTPADIGAMHRRFSCLRFFGYIKPKKNPLGFSEQLILGY